MAADGSRGIHGLFLGGRLGTGFRRGFRNRLACGLHGYCRFLGLTGFSEWKPNHQALVEYALSPGRKFLRTIDDQAEFFVGEPTECEVFLGFTEGDRNKLFLRDSF